MTRRDALLAILASAEGRTFSPVQIQKAMFLVDRNLPQIFEKNNKYNFIPYDYGPFDAAVYDEATSLHREGQTVIASSENGRWSTYSASDLGLRHGKFILANMKEEYRIYFEKVSTWVRSQSFSSLVKAIYDAYPDMRVNSVFKG